MSGLLRASHFVLVDLKIIIIYIFRLEGCLVIKFCINRGEKYSVKFTKTIGNDPLRSELKVFSKMGKVLKSERKTNHHYEK